ncbi:MAG: DUF362 domain-containing protein [Anaerolineae bacterium]
MGSRRLSRRDFLRLALVGTVAGCAPEIEFPAETRTSTAPPTVASIATPVPTESPPPTATSTATVSASETAVLTETPLPTKETAATADPTTEPVTSAPGRVVQVRHGGIWEEDRLSPLALKEMLDAGVAALTGVADPQQGWSALFSPGERVALKVNTIAGSSYWTHQALALALAERLQAAGIEADRIVVFDRNSQELEAAGYTLNRDGPGVRCYGTDGDYREGWTLLDTGIGLSEILLGCDVLINVPLLKSHGISGMSFALKNHYGTLDRPGHFHAPRIEQALGELNALPPIADRTRLIVGDALSICTRGWYDAVVGDAILMSTDPVAHDAVGLELLAEAVEGEGGNAAAARGKSSAWLAHAAEIGLGVADLAQIERLGIELGV